MSQKLNAHQSTVYEILGKRGGLTVAELATSFTGMSQTTVRKVLRELQNMQLVAVDTTEQRPYFWFRKPEPVFKPEPVPERSPVPEYADLEQLQAKALRARLAEARRTIEFLTAQNHRLLWGTDKGNGDESC